MFNWMQLSPSSYHSLPMGRAYGMTDVGLIRASNEDNFLIDPALGLILVGDGMGGSESGDVASTDALLAVRDFIRNLGLSKGRNQKSPTISAILSDAASYDPDATSMLSDEASYDPSYDPDATWADNTMPAVMALFDAVEFANASLYAKNLAQNNGDGHGMGTTLTGIWQSVKSGPLVVFHVGDSRLYRYRNGELTLLTRDQTLYQQAIEEGLHDNLPSRNLLLQAIGPLPSIKPEIKPHTMQAKDLYLLCSDGLHGSVPHGMIADILGNTDETHLDQACASLIAAAKEHGSRDNITALILAC